MNSYWGLAKYVGIALFGLGIGLWISGNHYTHKIEVIDKKAKEEQIKQLQEWDIAVQSRIQENKLLRENYEELKQEWDVRLDKAVKANADLSSKYSSLQLRLKGTSCPSTTGQGDSTSHSSDAEPSVAVSDETRRAVFDLRESIIKDQEVLRQWQEWWKLNQEKSPK